MNGFSIAYSYNNYVFPKPKLTISHNKQISLIKTTHYSSRLATSVFRRIRRKESPPNHHYHHLRIPVTSRHTVLSKDIPVKKITTDIIIDGCCIVGNVVLNCVNASNCASIFVTCIFNNIFLNLSVNGTRTFWKRSLYLFKLGLFTNTIGSLIYVQPFNVLLYIKYVVCLSLGMGILSNLRYSMLRNIEEKIKLSLIQCVVLRVLNNIVGTFQQISILQHIVL